MGRAALIINQAISEAITIDQQIKRVGIKKAKLYINNRDQDNNEFINHQVEPGDLIIATNLAGRGTDIETSEQLEKYGGIHVIVTFMPKNLRVQQQAFGRTGRQGKAGTAQLVLDLNKSIQGNLEDIIYAQKSFEANKRPETQISVRMNTIKIQKVQIVQRHIQKRNLIIKSTLNNQERYAKAVLQGDYQQKIKKLPQLNSRIINQQQIKVQNVLSSISNENPNIKYLRQKQNNLSGENKIQIQPNFLNTSAQFNKLEQSEVGQLNRIKQMRPKTQATAQKSDIQEEQEEEEEIEQFNLQETDLSDLCEFVRDKNEEAFNAQAIPQMKQMIEEDRQFEEYCTMLSSIEGIRKSSIIFSAIEEQWGIFLHQHRNNSQKLQEFCQKIKVEAQLGTIKKNPKQEISSALEADLINLEPLQRAINLNGNDWIAYYYSGLTQIKSGKVEQYQNGMNNFANAKQLLNIKIENIKAFHIAIQINQCLINQKDSSNSKFCETDNSQLQDQLKIYCILYQNINHIEHALKHFDQKREQLIVELQKTKQFINEPSLQSELDEIIADGPLPKIGKIRTIKIERAWWNYVLMFAIGIIQVIAGAAICAFSGGLAIPIGVCLMWEGIKDIFQAFYSGCKDLPIDWGQWGQTKVINFALILAQAGPAGLSELWSGIQNLQNVSILDVIKQMPSVMVEGTMNAGLYLGEQSLNKISHVTDIFSALEAIEFVNDNLNNKKKLKNVIRDFMLKDNIPEKVGDQILIISSEALTQSQISGSEDINIQFYLENLQKLSGSYIEYLKIKDSANRTEEDNKNCLKYVTQTSLTQLERQKTLIEEFTKLQKNTKQKLNQMNQEIISFLLQDEDISQKITWLQFYFDQNYDNEEEQQKFINSDFFPQQFEKLLIKNKIQLKVEVDQLNIDNQNQLNKFYTQTLKNITLDILEELKLRIPNKRFVPLQKLIIKEFVAIRNQLDLEIEQERIEREQTQSKLASEFSKLQDQIALILSDSNHTLAQINFYQLELKEYEQKLALYNQSREQFNNKVQQYNNQADSDEMRNSINVALNKLIEQKLILKDGITLKQGVQLEEILSKFSKFLKEEIKQNNPDLITILTEAFKKVYSTIENLQTTNVIRNRLFEAIDDEIVDFFLQQIFTEKLNKQANKIMQNIANGQ